MGAATPAATTEGHIRPSLSVAWVGPGPPWLELDEAKAELEGIEIEWVAATERITSQPHVAHVTRAALGELENVRQALPDSVLVLDLTGDGDAGLTRFEAGQTSRADVVLVGSHWELGELLRQIPTLPPRTGVVRRPLDLDWHAPEPRLAEAKGRGRNLRRFRRFHRLAGPVVLFAGPYTEAGGLDVLLEAVFRLREQMADLRLAAIPHGPTDARYRDRCEMRALGLGHHGIVEWNPAESEIPFWYAVAAVVCAPSCEAGSPEPAKRAAAAGRPFVGSDLEPFREHVDDGTTGCLVPAGELDALQATLERLLGAEDEAAHLGETARRKAEAEYSPAAAAKGLRQEWESSLEARFRSASGGGRLA
jgi:glycosyltransferase involved in cell wall biosynthesis